MPNVFTRALNWLSQWYSGSAESRRVGRNDPCWCGSGKKYKHCHMRTDERKGSISQTTTPAAQRELMERANKRIERQRGRLKKK